MLWKIVGTSSGTGTGVAETPKIRVAGFFKPLNRIF